MCVPVLLQLNQHWPFSVLLVQHIYVIPTLQCTNAHKRCCLLDRLLALRASNFSSKTGVIYKGLTTIDILHPKFVKLLRREYFALKKSDTHQTASSKQILHCCNPLVRMNLRYVYVSFYSIGWILSWFENQQI